MNYLFRQLCLPDNIQGIAGGLTKNSCNSTTTEPLHGRGQHEHVGARLPLLPPPPDAPALEGLVSEERCAGIRNDPQQGRHGAPVEGEETFSPVDADEHADQVLVLLARLVLGVGHSHHRSGPVQGVGQHLSRGARHASR